MGQLRLMRVLRQPDGLLLFMFNRGDNLLTCLFQAMFRGSGGGADEDGRVDESEAGQLLFLAFRAFDELLDRLQREALAARLLREFLHLNISFVLGLPPVCDINCAYCTCFAVLNLTRRIIG